MTKNTIHDTLYLTLSVTMLIAGIVSMLYSNMIIGVVWTICGLGLLGVYWILK